MLHSASDGRGCASPPEMSRNSLKVVKINTEKYPDIASRFQVRQRGGAAAQLQTSSRARRMRPLRLSPPLPHLRRLAPSRRSFCSRMECLSIASCVPVSHRTRCIVDGVSTPLRSPRRSSRLGTGEFMTSIRGRACRRACCRSLISSCACATSSTSRKHVLFACC